MKILVVAAHPNDEVLGCGGAISRYSQYHEVHIEIMGEGLTARLDRDVASPPDALDSLYQSGRKAAEILGAKNINFNGLPEIRFDTIPFLDIVRLIEHKINEFQPQMIFSHIAGGVNIDHQIVNRAVMNATRPVAGTPVKTIYAFEVPSSTEWAFGLYGAFVPNAFVNITGHLANKLAVMYAYEPEAKNFPHPRSPESLTAIAVKWGSTVGVHHAEAFQIIRHVT